MCSCFETKQRNNEEMVKGIITILCCYSSTEEDPQHQYHPENETSWSKFQVSKHNGGHLHRPVKDPIPNAVKEVTLLVFEKLGNHNF